MAAKLGTSDVFFRLGANPPSAVYLGATQVLSAVAVPGAPTIIFSGEELGDTYITFSAPESDGGSAISGYKFYVDGVEVSPDFVSTSEARFVGQVFAGQELEMSAVNAAGEGPKSDPVTVT
jgi:hypothetical protein